MLEAVSTVYQGLQPLGFVEHYVQINDNHGHASEEVLQMLKRARMLVTISVCKEVSHIELRQIEW
jgi:hypothetical protein